MITVDNAQTPLQTAFAYVQQEHLVHAHEFPKVWDKAPDTEILKAYTIGGDKLFLTESEYQNFSSVTHDNVVNIFDAPPKRADLKVELYRTPPANLEEDINRVRADMKWIIAVPDVRPEPEVLVPGPIETDMGLSVPRTFTQELPDIKPLDEPIFWNKTDGIVEYLHIFKNLPKAELEKECSSACYRTMIVALKRNLWVNDGVNTEFARRLRNEGFTVNYVAYRHELTVIVHPEGPFVWKV